MDFRHPLAVVTPTLDGDVLAVLAGADEDFSGRRIHQLLRQGSENGVRNAAERLVEQGVVLSRRAGPANLYRLNRDHLAAPYIEGLSSLRAQLLDRMRDTIARWSVPPSSALVFGSVARSEAGPSSDLDLVVIRPSPVGEDDEKWREQLALLEDVTTAWTGNEAQVIEYKEADLDDPGVRQLVEKALAEGIELYDSRRLRRMLKDRAA
jgi:predicted nucleotidyltransferase